MIKVFHVDEKGKPAQVKHYRATYFLPDPKLLHGGFKVHYDFRASSLGRAQVKALEYAKASSFDLKLKYVFEVPQRGEF